MEKSKNFYLCTKKEMEAMRAAFNKMYRILDGGASTLQDYFKEHEDYIRFERANALINDRPFDRSDHE